MPTLGPSSRYSSFDTRSSAASSFQSDPSSSADLKRDSRSQSVLKRLIRRPNSDSRPDLAIATGNSRPLLSKHHQTSIVSRKNEQFSLVKKFVETRSKSKAKAVVAAPKGTGLFIPSDVIADDLKRVAGKGSTMAALHRKLFSKGSKEKLIEINTDAKKALEKGKSNSRTLAVILKSERELLNQNKDLKTEVAQMKSMLEQRNNEVEKLKALCLKQRAELKSLKSAIPFRDEMDSQHQKILQKPESNMKDVTKIIPDLQKQVTFLTGQLLCLAEDLAEVKSDKNSFRGVFDGCVSSPITPIISQEAANSFELSSGDTVTFGSREEDRLLLDDINPCLTPRKPKIKAAF